MRVAVISDIHGNHYALSEVLKDAKRNNIDHICVLGDFVGYYYRPDIVLELLSDWSCTVIKGNHEVILEQLLEEPCQRENVRKKYGSGHEEAIGRLSKANLKYLFDLPQQTSISIGGVQFQLNHGSPWRMDEYLYPTTDKVTLDRCDSSMYDFVLVGHSHYSFIHNCKNSVLINCGSVGQSRQKGGVAFWAVVDTTSKFADIKRTSYDVSPLIVDVQGKDADFEYSLNVLNR